MAGEVLPAVRDVPVLAGVCGTHPFRLMPRFLDELAAERLPVERALTAQVRAFTELSREEDQT
jgi:predicted TIM-barrel enzyme